MASFRWSKVVDVLFSGFGIVAVVMSFLSLMNNGFMWCQVYVFLRAVVGAYQESKKRVDVEEGQFLETPGSTWVEGVACVHQLHVFRLVVMGLVGGAMCVRGEVVSKDVDWDEK
jgi:hypothetical protein